MDEFSVILKARQFIRDAGISSIPVDIEKYATAAKAKIKVSFDLDEQESGQTFPLAGKHIITTNGNHREERQRFTVLHEIAHIVLELPSQHHGTNITTSDLVSYRRRPKEEILCDVFAAECLLPYDQFRRDVENVDVSLDEVKELANRYKASVTSTGSRFAVNCNAPCAFVLMEHGKIRYVSMSKFLRELNGWIDFGIPIPKGSVVDRISKSASAIQDYDEIPVDVWFTNGVKGYDLLTEEAMTLREWEQCLSLIWFDDDLSPTEQSRNQYQDVDAPLLEELDGVLPWPSKSRRKK
ncbi:MAG: ImmA/IrrE family metallo-endopeptidase [Candidatus Thiodiazotropha sp. (ex Dulcina madagascariensis)]|nr:ImmA/IrrE family metallo-endopeptidase [Candidatus Thiodiazotropha sp. (ex Dulcina madagascariensis)]